MTYKASCFLLHTSQFDSAWSVQEVSHFRLPGRFDSGFHGNVIPRTPRESRTIRISTSSKTTLIYSTPAVTKGVLHGGSECPYDYTYYCFWAPFVYFSNSFPLFLNSSFYSPACQDLQFVTCLESLCQWPALGQFVTSATGPTGLSRGNELKISASRGIKKSLKKRKRMGEIKQGLKKVFSIIICIII